MEMKSNREFKVKKSLQPIGRIKVIKNLDELGFNTPIGFALLSVVIYVLSISIASLYFRYIKHYDLISIIAKDAAILYLAALIGAFTLLILGLMLGPLPQLVSIFQHETIGPFNEKKLAYANCWAIATPTAMLLLMFAMDFFSITDRMPIYSTLGVFCLAVYAYLLAPTEQGLIRLDNNSQSKLMPKVLKSKRTKFFLVSLATFILLLASSTYSTYPLIVLYQLYPQSIGLDKNSNDVIRMLVTFGWQIIYICVNSHLLLQKKTQTTPKIQIDKHIIHYISCSTRFIYN